MTRSHLQSRRSEYPPVSPDAAKYIGVPTDDLISNVYDMTNGDCSPLAGISIPPASGLREKRETPQ